MTVKSNLTFMIQVQDKCYQQDYMIDLWSILYYVQSKRYEICLWIVENCWLQVTTPITSISLDPNGVICHQ